MAGDFSRKIVTQDKATFKYVLECKHLVQLDISVGWKSGDSVHCPFCQQENRVQTQPADIQHFESGASTSGDLPPYETLTLEFLRRCAFRMKLGMHYGKHNWKKGAKDKEFILNRLSHAVEHLYKAMAQIDNNTISDDDDLAAVCVNCMFAMEYQYNTISNELSKPENPAEKKIH